MSIEQRQDSVKHTVTVDGRKNLRVTGVEDIVSFDDTNIILKTVMGLLSADGSELRIVNLNRENKEALICGTVSGLYYADENADKKGGFFTRIFGQ